MAKQGAIAGFPEWLPEQRMIELELLDRIRQKFELFGFTSLETRAVEPLDVLTQKGATDKEIYVIKRLHADDDAQAELGLHFDLTVPFARYVAQHRGQLVFPMKRYQIQKVWRGERPQEGRYREFYQADVDVIGDGTLPMHFDAEMALLLHEVTAALPVPPIQLRINNRKVLEGFYRALGVTDITGVLRTVDKLDKIGEEGVAKALVDDNGMRAEDAEQCLALARIRGGMEVADAVRALGVESELMEEGLSELLFVMQALEGLPPEAALLDLHIARGLDYYTGTVYEGVMQGHEGLGAVCSGGRYDDLASGGKGPKLPGVGVSVGISRLTGWLLAQGQVTTSRGCPTAVLVALNDDASRAEAYRTASKLRAKGVATEVFHATQKFGKQIRYAERKGIPFVLFLTKEGVEVRDIRTGEQSTVDLASWMPPEEDLRARVIEPAR